MIPWGLSLPRLCLVESWEERGEQRSGSCEATHHKLFIHYTADGPSDSLTFFFIDFFSDCKANPIVIIKTSPLFQSHGELQVRGSRWGLPVSASLPAFIAYTPFHQHSPRHALCWTSQLHFHPPAWEQYPTWSFSLKVPRKS